MREKRGCATAATAMPVHGAGMRPRGRSVTPGRRATAEAGGGASSNDAAGRDATPRIVGATPETWEGSEHDAEG